MMKGNFRRTRHPSTGRIGLVLPGQFLDRWYVGVSSECQTVQTECCGGSSIPARRIPKRGIRSHVVHGIAWHSKTATDGFTTTAPTESESGCGRSTLQPGKVQCSSRNLKPSNATKRTLPRCNSPKLGRWHARYLP